MNRNHQRRQKLAQSASPYHRRQPSSRPSGLSPKPHTSRRGENNLDFLNDKTCVNEDLDLEANKPNTDDTFRWDEEAALLLELLDEGEKQNDEDEMEKLIDSLQGAFTDEGKQAKKEIARSLVGTHKHVKHLYKLIDDNVDPAYGQGIHLIDEATIGIEAALYAQQTELTKAFTATQRKVDSLLDELKEEYTERDKLWVNINKSMNKIVTPVQASIKNTPAQLDRTIVELEKELAADSTEVPSTFKMLQALLANSS